MSWSLPSVGLVLYLILINEAEIVGRKELFTIKLNFGTNPEGTKQKIDIIVDGTQNAIGNMSKTVKATEAGFEPAPSERNRCQ
jgi:hypothetical protein